MAWARFVFAMEQPRHLEWTKEHEPLRVVGIKMLSSEQHSQFLLWTGRSRLNISLMCKVL